MMILKAQPSLLSNAISSMVLNWEIITFEHCCVLSHLIYLLDNVAIDQHVISQLNSLINNETDSIKQTNKTKEIIDTFFLSLIPINLTKKDIIKLLNSTNLLIIRLILILMQSITNRLNVLKSHLSFNNNNNSNNNSNNSNNNIFEFQLNSSFHNHFPELQLFINLRSK